MRLAPQRYFDCVEVKFSADAESEIKFASTAARRAISLASANLTGAADFTRRKANLAEKAHCIRSELFLVGAGGFEPP